MLIEITKKSKFARLTTIHLPRKGLATPTYFPAVSSSGNDLTINEVKFLMKTNYPCMLISAHDYHHIFSLKPSVEKSINSYSKKGKFLFVDSGGYERKWNNDEDWNFKIYEDTIKKIQSDFYTSLDFDLPKIVPEESFKNIINSYSLLPESQFVPIFDGNNKDSLIRNVKKFLTRYENYVLKFIAVREKDCGLTLTERASTIFRLRKLFDQKSDEIIIHVLGCGQPLSIALYSYFGADSFDSRDWSLKTVDIKLMSLRDVSHLQIMKCRCKACRISSKKKYNPLVTTVYHNIMAYLEFTNKIHLLIKGNKLRQFLVKNGITNSMLKEIQN